MTPTSDYREVTDAEALRAVAGRDVLVRPRGHAYGYVAAHVEHSQDARQWVLAYVAHDRRVRRVVLYQTADDLLKSVQVMANCG